jgi:hypothetical protein
VFPKARLSVANQNSMDELLEEGDKAAEFLNAFDAVQSHSVRRRIIGPSLSFVNFKPMGN